MAIIVSLTVTTLCGGVRDVAGQEPDAVRRRIPITDSVYTRITTFAPRSGEAGTEVAVQTTSLPALTPVQITIGGTRSGFEVLSQLMTDRDGEISDTVRIPAWTKPDGTYMFIVVDMYFEPLAASDVFHVTGPGGTVLRKGRIMDEGTECPRMRGADGELYTLSGATEQLEPGDYVIVEGTLAESPDCGQGTTIDVIRVRPDPSRRRKPILGRIESATVVDSAGATYD